MPDLKIARPALMMALHLVLGVLLGVLADVGLRGDCSIIFVFAAATPWILLAFSAGRATGFRWSAGAGALVIAAGLCSYYTWLNLGQGVDRGVLFGRDYGADLWLIGGAVIGAIAGVTGGLTQVSPQLVNDLAWSAITVVPVGDGYVMLRYYTIEGWALPSITTVATAAAILWWAKRAGARTSHLAVTAPLALSALIALEIVALHALHRLT